MATINDTKNNIITVSSSILVVVDNNNIGEMYVYDDKYSYILNGLTASDLVSYFAETDQAVISKEIISTMMEMTINQGTH